MLVDKGSIFVHGKDVLPIFLNSALWMNSEDQMT